MRLVVRMTWLFMTFAYRVAVVGVKHLWSQTTRPFRERKAIQLRDAMTGEKLGLTKKQYKRLVYALGTKDERLMIKAFKEARSRRLAAN